MKIQVKEMSTVRPAQETAETRLWTCNLDLVVSRAHILTVYFYRDNGCGNFFEARVLKAALSRALVPFYPVAGRLGRDDNGRVEVRCEGQGALFVEAVADSAVDDLGELNPSSELRQLVPAVDYSGDISSYPLLIAQVTYFRSGGISLGVGIHHILADGCSALHFINTWADISRGLSVSIPPILDRTLLRARPKPAPAFRHEEFDPPPRMDEPDAESGPRAKSTATFKISAEMLAELAAKCGGEERGIRMSTYEVLAAHVWRCTCAARGLREGQATRLYMPVDGRARLRPPLPAGYFGNVVFTATADAAAGEVQAGTLADTTERIHGALKRMDDEYLRSVLDFLELQPDLAPLVRGAHTFRSPNLIVNQWNRLPLYDADFGWGKPIYVGPASLLFEGLAYIMRAPSPDRTLTLAICLEDRHVQRFKDEFYKV